MKDNSKGYTLIELSLIVFVLSIIMAIAAPNIRSAMNSYRLSAFDRIIISDIRFAQQEASINWRESRLYFNNASRKIYVKQGTKIIKSDTYPNLVKLDYTNFSSDEIRFNEFGNPSRGGSIHVACGNQRHTITILPVTGRVKLYEYEKN
jgi:Tfp pilus assembly protein FimT